MNRGNTEIGMGYLRPDGRIGIRNRVLVIYLSACARFVATRIARTFSPDAVEVIGFTRCVESPFTEMKLSRYATHANVGAVLVVGNGCEPLNGDVLVDTAEKSGRGAVQLVIRDSGGVAASVEKGIAAVRALLEGLARTPRTPIHYADLVIGTKCGGSDFTSGLAANPLVGRFYDRMVDLGATVIFEEMYEAIGLKDYLVSRCTDAHAAESIARTYDKFFLHSKESNQFFITPGNMNGGLTTIEEKSMGAVIKSGTRPIQGVIKLGERAPHPGLWMLDGMTDTEEHCGPYVSDDATSMLFYPSCGVNLSFLTSGRGHLVCTPIAPTLKITGNRRTMQNLRRDTDFDASPALYGERTLDQLAGDLFALVGRIAAGQRTKGEALGHREGVINQELQFSSAAPGQGGCRHG